MVEAMLGAIVGFLAVIAISVVRIVQIMERA